MRLIDKQPTIYDTDNRCKDCAGCMQCKCDEANAIQEYISKVAEQLEELKSSEQDNSVAEIISTRIWNKAIQKSIEIVKGGRTE